VNSPARIHPLPHQTTIKNWHPQHVRRGFESNYNILLVLLHPFIMEPSFPLDPRRGIPTCRMCGRACTRDMVTIRNPIGHVGRFYYHCYPCPRERSGAHGVFSTWDDYEGITNGNPRCRCGFTSRRDTNRTTKEDFFACPNRYNKGCGWSMTCSDVATPQANSIAVVKTSPQYGNSQYGNPQHSNSQYGNSQYSNSQYRNAQYSTPQYGNPAYSQYGSPQYGNRQQNVSPSAQYNPYPDNDNSRRGCCMLM
jgi:hypothetical protein